MRIKRTTTFAVKYLLSSNIKRLPIAVFAIATLIGGTVLYQNIVTPNQAMAITPPDSCFAFNSGTGTITDYYDNEGNNSANPACPKNVDIPSSIGGVVAAKIAINAFRSNQLTSVTIPNSVISIGNNAFYDNQLTSVTIPDSVTSISNYAFRSNQLTSVSIPNSVTSIGNSAFSTNQLTSVTIPNSVTSIGNSAFYNNQLTSVTIPNSVTSIGSSAFSYNQLTSVTISNASAGMQHNSFSENPITSMTIGGTTYTEQSPTTNPACFAMSGSIVTGYYPLSPVVARDNGVLCGHDVTIPNSVTSIVDYAFQRNQLTSVTIPNSVTSIGYSAFSGNQLTSVVVPDSVTSLGEYAFSNNRLASASLPAGLSTIESGVFYDNFLTSIEIPPTVTSIGRSAFAFNKLKTVEVPAAVQSIDEYAFAVQNTWGAGLENDYESDHYLWSYYESNSHQIVQAAYDAMWYARLYSADSSNPNSLQSAIITETDWVGYDGNGDGKNNSLGGHLINPSRLTVAYKDDAGNTIKDSRVYVGKDLITGNYLDDYMVSNGPSIDGMAEAPIVYSSYYRLGDTVTLTPPAIPGYITPAPKTFTLSDPETVGDFVYKKQVKSVDFGSTEHPGVAPAMASATFTVDDSKPCSNIDDSELLPASDFTAPESDYVTLGGLDFTLSCTEPGGEAAVSLVLKQKVADTSELKVYKKTADGKVTDITTHTTISTQNNRTTITYNLTDGGVLDDDKTVNGQIVDPIYVAVPADSALAGNSNGGALADTGFDARAAAVISLTSIVIGFAISLFAARKKFQRG